MNGFPRLNVIKKQRHKWSRNIFIHTALSKPLIQLIGRQLLAKLTQVAQLQKRTALTLTCLSRLIPFYEHVGFHNDGLAASTHAGEVWFNMSKPVKPVAKI